MLMNNNEYLDLVQNIKQEIQHAQYKAALSVNKELIGLYYNIGQLINEHKTWGSKFIENLAADIKLSFPDAKGYSVRNLKYMAKFALRFPDFEIVQAALAQFTWYHHIALMDKVKTADEHIWYAEQVSKNGWSRNVLVHQIESGLYARQVIANKISNFENRLASPQSELAVQTMKDPYIFDFIPFIVFNVNIGKNIEFVDYVVMNEYYPHINNDGSITFYHPVVNINCSEDNKHFYSNDRKLYFRKNDELVFDFAYLAD